VPGFAHFGALVVIDDIVAGGRDVPGLHQHRLDNILKVFNRRNLFGIAVGRAQLNAPRKPFRLIKIKAAGYCGSFEYGLGDPVAVVRNHLAVSFDNGVKIPENTHLYSPSRNPSSLRIRVG